MVATLLRPRAGRRPLVPTVPGAATVEGVELFAAGRHRGDPYPVSFLDAVVNNFQRFTGESGRRLGVVLDPPAVLGHDDEQAILRQQGLPAAGWVWNLWRHGAKLFADLNDVPPQIARAINSRAYRKVSAEFRENFSDQGRDFGPVLWRVALLGAEVPQVKSLADLPLATFADAAAWPRRLAEIRTVRRWSGGGRVICFSEVTPMQREDMIKAIKAQLPWLSGPTLDGLSDDQLAGMLKDVMAAGQGAAASGDPNAPPTHMADPGTTAAAPPAAPGAGLPGGAADDPLLAGHAPAAAPAGVAGIPGIPPVTAPPSKLTVQFADMTREMAAIRAEQAETRRLTLERLGAEKTAKVDRFWDELVRKGKKQPHEEGVTKLLLSKCEDGKTRKFADAGDRLLSELDYCFQKMLAGPTVLKFSEQMPAGGAGGPGGISADRRAAILGATVLGRTVLKAEQQKQAAAK